MTSKPDDPWLAEVEAVLREYGVITGDATRGDVCKAVFLALIEDENKEADHEEKVTVKAGV